MIGVRTPFRISLSGGSTDIESFYKDNGGKVISSSINKFMYHFIHKFDKELIQIKYSQTELVEDPSQIKHRIVKPIPIKSTPNFTKTQISTNSNNKLIYKHFLV